jgi:hypothetical protein
MGSVSDDVVQFLRSRLDEDEQAARKAAAVCGCHPPAPSWSFSDEETDGRILVVDDPHPGLKRKLGRRWNRSYEGLFTAEHIVRHDPAQVLREVEAKRQLLDDLNADQHHRNEEDHWYSCAVLTDEHGETLCSDEGRAPGPCDCGRDTRVARRLRLLGLPYADHPDYREDWRP